MSRVSQNSGKELLLARVEVPRLTESDLASPNVVRRLSVAEVRVRPWVPGLERWDQKPAVPVEAGTGNTKRRRRGEEEEQL